MSLDDALRIVNRLGPRTVAIDRDARPELARQLALLGCVVRPFGDAVARVAVIGVPGEIVPGAIETLVVVTPIPDRLLIEAPLLAGGWRRHPAGLLADEARDWSANRVPRISFYQRRPAADDLLGRGAAADPAIARFAMAAALARSGDRVLVAGSDAAAGGEIVAALSRAGEVVVAAGALDRAAPHSFDLIVFAGIVDARLAEVAMTALKADGRFVVTGEVDGAAVEDRFIVERSLVQPDGGTLVIASANPLEATPRAAYRHPGFHRGEGERPVLVDFAAAYENPHLYRVMVQLGERLGDEIKLARLAECVLDEAGAASADRGAAITVLGYRVLERGLVGSVPAIVALIDAYLAATEGHDAQHVLRWRLSLLFLAGRLAELADEPAVAIERFRAASLADWRGFSPILATKAIAAAFHEARLHLATDARAAAMACFRRGLDIALAAAAAPHEWLIGDRDAPVPFYFQEMAEVMDMGGQCAVALNNAPLLDRDPGLFWRQVDAKRFGLFAWADSLAREQARQRT